MRYVIVGCGRMGVGLALALRRAGHDVVFVDDGSGAAEELEPSLCGRLVAGGCFDRDTLIRAGIEQADGLAAVTESDETNVVIARLARLVFLVPRVVAGLHEPQNAELYHRLGVQVVAPHDWAVNRIVDVLLYSESEVLASLGNGQAEIVSFPVPPLLEGRKTQYLTVFGEVHVVAVGRQGRIILPSSETAFMRDDIVYVAVLRESSERLRSILALT